MLLGLVFKSFFMFPGPKALSFGLLATSIEDARESLVSLDAAASEQASSNGTGEAGCILSWPCTSK